MGRVVPASSASKERLERISHHFLSGPENASGDGPAAAARAPLVIPVLTVPDPAAFPFERLSRALLVRGRPAAVLDARGDVQGASRPIPSTKAHRDTSVPPAEPGGGGGLAPPDAAPVALDRLADAARALNPVPDVCLVPLDAEDWPVPDAFARPLLAVPAGREGLSEGFLAVKQAHAWGLAGPVGVVLTDAPDPAAAARHFDTLAEALWCFLGLEAVSYGCLPAPPPPHAPVDLLGPGPEARLEAALMGVARLLIADLPPVTATRAKARKTT